MAPDPVPTPRTYLEPQNTTLSEQLAALSGGKQINQLSVAKARRLVHEAQTPAPPHPDITISHFEVKTSHGAVKTFLYRPKHTHGDVPFLFHAHGGGWILNGAFEYEAFIFDLLTRTGFAVVFPEYTLVPEDRFPVQQEQCLEVLEWVVRNGASKGLVVDRVAVSGDSAGGHLASSISILNHKRKLGLPIVHQVLFHPVVDATSLTSTFSQFLFQDGPFLSNAFLQKAFTDYFGDKIKERSSITASLILMTPQQAREFMTPTTVITSQEDWLRDQGQNFAKLLQTAGVSCGVIQKWLVCTMRRCWM